MATTAREFVRELEQAETNGHIAIIVEKYHRKEIRLETSFDRSIQWYRDGSATYIDEESKGIQVWMDDTDEGYLESKRYFESL